MKITRLRSQPGQRVGKIFQLVDQHVDHFVLPLQPPAGDIGRGGAGYAIKTLPDILPNDEIHRAGLVFERDERDALGRAGRCRTNTMPATRTARSAGCSAKSSADTIPNSSKRAR